MLVHQFTDGYYAILKLCGHKITNLKGLSGPVVLVPCVSV